MCALVKVCVHVSDDYALVTVAYVHTHTALGLPPGRYRKPLTTSHEVGWHAVGPTAPSLRYADNHPRKATEITINEGMSLEKYYG